MQSELVKTIVERRVIVKLLRQTEQDKARLAELEGALLVAYADNADLQTAAKAAHTLYARFQAKVKACSESRHKRLGRTITTFYVWFDGDPTSQRLVDGHGPTPGERKTCAMQAYIRLQLAEVLRD